MRAPQRLAALLAVGLVAACASAAGAGGVRSSSDTITREEITTSGAQTAYQLVQSLRPEWLRTRGIQSLSESTHTVGRSGNSGAPAANGDDRISIPNAGRPQVSAYLGQVRLGDMQALEQVMAVDVETIRFLSPQQATLRYGANHTHGAIVVTVR
jgi:ABC-type phosphate transport system substrate-binding protein